MKNKKLLSGLLLLILTVPLLSACRERTTTEETVATTLTIYGLDSSDALSPIINAYKSRQPKVTVRYKKFENVDDYENLLVNEIAEGEGPDLFYIGNTWLPRHTKKLVPLSSQSLTPETYGTAFVNVAKDDFVKPDPKDGVQKIYAVPLFVDTLALYYNQDHYEKAIPERGKPPVTWDEVKLDSPKLRKISPDGSVLERGSVALGQSDTVSLAEDILMNFFVQGGVSFYDADFKQAKFAQDGQKYFDTFLNFANRRAREFGWSSELADTSLKTVEPEVDAFVTGKVSSIIAYANLSSRLETEIKNAKARGSNVIAQSDVKIAPVPQVSAESANQRVLAHYYGLAVSRNSKNAALAWDFAQFAVSKEMSRQYLAKTKLPSARRDLLDEQKKDPLLSVFVSQVGSATTIPLYSVVGYRTFINAAIDAATKGMSSRNALSEAQAKINELLKREAPNGMYPKPPVAVKK